MRPRGGKSRRALAVWIARDLCTPALMEHDGRSRAFRPPSAARGLKYYPGVFNYLFLVSLQGALSSSAGVAGCGGARSARRGLELGKWPVSILKPFTIVSSMKDAANKTEPPAPASLHLASFN